MPTPNEDALKIGRMLSSANQEALQAAYQNLGDVLSRAGVPVGCDDTPQDAPTPDPAPVKYAPDMDLIVSAPRTGTTIKAIGDDGRFGGYLVVWGDPQHKDLQGEYFTRDTDFCLDWYSKRPSLYHHGMDGTLKAEPIGELEKLTPDDVGLWAEGQLDLRNKYVQAIQRLIQKGALQFSSGSVPHLVEVKADGHITKWPIIEGSMTPTPAEPRNTNIMPVKAIGPATPLEALIGAIEVGEPASAATADSADKGTASNAPRNTPTTRTKSDPPQAPSPAPRPPAPAAPLPTNKDTSSTMDNMQTLVSEILDLILSSLGNAAPALDDNAKQQLVQQVVSGLSQKDDAMPDDTATDDTDKAAQMGAAVTAKVKAVLNEYIMRQAARAAAKSTPAPAMRPASQVAPAAVTPAPTAPRIQVRGKYDDLSLEDMSYLAMLNTKGNKRPLARELAQAIAGKAADAYQKGEWTGVEDRYENTPEGYVPASVKAAFYMRDALTGMKANELDNTGQSGFGQEWVPDVWASNIWKRKRLDNFVVASLPSVEMPSNLYELPIESTDPTVYFVPETTADSQLQLTTPASSAIPDSKVGTGKAQLSAKKLALRVGFSAEEQEDSIIPFITQLRAQSERALLNAMDNVVLNGDTVTTANTNINLIDGTPGSTAIYLAFDGIRKLPLVTATTLSIDAGGVSPTLSLIRKARAALLNAYGADPNALRIACDFPTYIKLLNMPEFLTMDKAGPNATAQAGTLGFLDGIQVGVSNELSLTNNTGKVSATGSNNTLGQVIVYAPFAWTFGYRRRVSISVDFLPYYDAYQLTATVRIALNRRDALCAAEVYDLAV